MSEHVAHTRPSTQDPHRDAPTAPASHRAWADLGGRVFHTALPWLCVVAGFAHLLFLGLFVWARVPALALLNVASVLVYAAGFVLARRGRVAQVTILAAAEVVAHAVVATAVIGWDTGFGYYILLVLPVLVVSDLRPRAVRVAGALLIAALYIGLDWSYRGRGAWVELAPAVVLVLHYVNVVGVMAILCFLAALYHFLIEQAQAALRDLASHDSLTGLRNRRAMEELIGYAEQRLRRSAGSLSFLMCDLDRFKAINDAFGHAAGDAVLQRVSRALTACVRSGDVVCRWGGEEFLAMLVDTDPSEAMRVAQRMCSAVQRSSVVLPDGRSLSVTMSVGVATLTPGEATEHAIARADAALYRSKGDGGNRVVRAGAERPA